MQVAVVTLALAIWLLLYFTEGQFLVYLRDDIRYLEPILLGSFADSLTQGIRPLAFIINKANLSFRLPLWIPLSAILYALTSLLAFKLATSINDKKAPLISLLAAVSSPLLAQTYFQIDTLSQMLSNVFCLWIILLVIYYSKTLKSSTVGYTILLSLFALASKETAYGVVATASIALFTISLASQASKRTLAACTIPGLLTLGMVIVREFTPHRELGNGAYALTLDPLTWLYHTTFMGAVAIWPFPSSLLYTGMAFRNAPLFVGFILSAIVLLFLAFTFISSLLRKNTDNHLKAVIISDKPKLPATFILAVFTLASLTPAIFIRASELYASAATLLINILAISVLMPALNRNMAVVVALITVFGFQLASSWVNLSVMRFSSQSDHYQNTEESPGNSVGGILEAQGAPLRSYSHYWPVRSQPWRFTKRGDCIYDVTLPNVCLPLHISKHFPYSTPHSGKEK